MVKPKPKLIQTHFIFKMIIKFFKIYKKKTKKKCDTNWYRSENKNFSKLDKMRWVTLNEIQHYDDLKWHLIWNKANNHYSYLFWICHLTLERGSFQRMLMNTHSALLLVIETILLCFQSILQLARSHKRPKFGVCFEILNLLINCFRFTQVSWKWTKKKN